MFTNILYLDPTVSLNCIARVLHAGNDNLGCYVILDQTTTHVRGGGQLGDRGSIGNAKLVDVRRVNDDVRHYVEGEIPSINAIVDVLVDADFRSTNTRWHTAGHLLAAALEHEVPGFSASTAQQWPSEAWIAGNWSEPLADDLLSRLQAFVDGAIAADLRIFVELGDVRTVTIEGHRSVPCGGTHLNSTSSIGFLRVEEVRIKKGVLKARYACSGIGDM